MHSQSRTWIAPHVRERETNRAVNAARRKICPKSFVWPENFNIEEHRREYAADVQRARNRRLSQGFSEAAERVRLDRMQPLPEQKPIPKPFGGKTFTTKPGSFARSPVLSRTTIFQHSWRHGKTDIAPWPTRKEQQHEGDDRIATDPLHRRFLAAPRVEGTDPSGWQHLAIVDQYAMDDFYWPLPTVEDVWWRGWRVREREFTDEAGRIDGEGRLALGGRLIEELEWN